MKIHERLDELYFSSLDESIDRYKNNGLLREDKDIVDRTNFIMLCTNILCVKPTRIMNTLNCKACLRCGIIPNKKLKQCKRCRNAYYCDRICQKKDWIVRHKTICRDHSI